MKHCPNDDCPFIEEHGERATYEDHAPRCIDCGAALAPGDPPAAPAPKEKTGSVQLAVLAEFDEPMDANGVVLHLDAERIPVFMNGRYVTVPLHRLPPGSKYVLEVREADLEAARAILEEPAAELDPEELADLQELDEGEEEELAEACERCGGTSFEIRTRRRKGLAALLRGPEEQYRVCTQCQSEA